MRARERERERQENHPGTWLHPHPAPVGFPSRRCGEQWVSQSEAPPPRDSRTEQHSSTGGAGGVTSFTTVTERGRGEVGRGRERERERGGKIDR